MIEFYKDNEELKRDVDFNDRYNRNLYNEAYYRNYNLNQGAPLDMEHYRLVDEDDPYSVDNAYSNRIDPIVTNHYQPKTEEVKKPQLNNEVIPEIKFNVEKGSTLFHRPTIQIPLDIERKYRAVIDAAFPSEFAWMGTAKLMDNGDIALGKFFIWMQEALSSAHAEIETDTFWREMDKLDPEDNANLKAFVHSHASMSSFWSGTDTGTIERTFNSGWGFSLVSNKKYERTSRLDVIVLMPKKIKEFLGISRLRFIMDNLESKLIPGNPEAYIAELEAAGQKKVIEGKPKFDSITLTYTTQRRIQLSEDVYSRLFYYMTEGKDGIGGTFTFDNNKIDNIKIGEMSGPYIWCSNKELIQAAIDEQMKIVGNYCLVFETTEKALFYANIPIRDPESKILLGRDFVILSTFLNVSFEQSKIDKDIETEISEQVKKCMPPRPAYTTTYYGGAPYYPKESLSSPQTHLPAGSRVDPAKYDDIIKKAKDRIKRNERKQWHIDKEKGMVVEEETYTIDGITYVRHHKRKYKPDEKKKGATEKVSGGSPKDWRRRGLDSFIL